ncbi:peptidase M18, aminopeptidase I [Metschnikowia bicuspidata var. bicuspidata NRRL YB-4993]|uniref:aspartyl aminopeptidase n=1 Tax=Metschnikowia bicuspidata var. bicuspidata NRRL YB-4993 TaxID=869754 RepID=A0A1A0H6R2_9ASCO|nr:peptidase M18, aminopeptidase I [Metschnikowia bicuspidata var. bicuspidata NRRL YB-4993]OBA19598.1 peptidase M18, aminopeptidase I [Metschnikowia bicuspidata var. bicuspidata NRRL YB-4993]
MDSETQTKAQGLVDFITYSPTPYHAVANVKQKLTLDGFVVLKEKDQWDLQPGQKYVVTRNASSLIAFKIGQSFRKGGPVAIVGAHTDSPCLRIKPISKKSGEGFIQIGVEQYGGLIAHSWFDRDLSVAGRVYVREKSGKYVPRLVHLRKPLMRIPTLAIHLDREVNKKFEFNKETELLPIAGQEKFGHSCADDPNLQLSTSEFEAVKHVVERHNESLLILIAKDLGVEVSQIEDFELLLCDYQDATLGGMHDEFIFAPRQDNLTSCFASMEALLASEPAEEGALMISLFDHEEIGSVSAQGADSSFLPDVLARLADSDNGAMARMCSRSFLLSSDQAHGVHPNYERVYEKANRPHVNGGPVIKINANQRYATNSRGIVLIKAVAQRAKVPLQLFVVRNDSPCGSTIGPMLSAKLGLRTLDLGNPQLSMHSIRETGGAYDVVRLTKLFGGFFAEYVDVDAAVECD